MGFLLLEPHIKDCRFYELEMLLNLLSLNIRKQKATFRSETETKSTGSMTGCHAKGQIAFGGEMSSRANFTAQGDICRG